MGEEMTLENGILGFLAMKPMSGYDIKKLFTMSASFFWPADQTQIYRTLRTLEKDGRIERIVLHAEMSIDKKVYAITEKGREENFLSIMRTDVDDFISRDAFLMQLFFSGVLDAQEQIRFLDTQIHNSREMEQHILDNYDKNFGSFLEYTGLDEEDSRVRSAVWAHRWGLVKCREYAKLLRQMRKTIKAGMSTQA